MRKRLRKKKGVPPRSRNGIVSLAAYSMGRHDGAYKHYADSMESAILQGELGSYEGVRIICNG